MTSIIYSGVYNCYAEMTLELPDGKSIDDVVNSWDKWGTAYVELNSGEIIKAEIVDLKILALKNIVKKELNLKIF